MAKTISDKDLARGRGPLWLTYVLALAILLGTQLYGLSLYAGLPGRIPTHWGPSGAPDAFSTKSPAAVYGMLWAGGGIVLALAFIAAIVPAIPSAHSSHSEYRLVHREGMFRGTISALGLLAVGMAALFSYLAIAGWRHPEHLSALIGVLFVAITLAILGCSFRWGSRWARRRAAELGLEPTADEAAEERHWVAGGLFYNDPADPQFLVPKREGTGVGLTVNIGNPKGKWAIVIFLLLIIGLPIGLSVGAALGSS